MKELIIKSYIKNLSKNDILKFANNNNINLQEFELNYIYNNIKYNYENIINNPKFFLEEIRNKFNPKAYQKIYELYTIYYPKLYH